MKPDYEVFATHIILPSGDQLAAEFLVWESDPADVDQVKLALKYAGKQIVVSDDDFVAVLRRIRLQLEQDHMLLNCYGASRNVYSSPMSISMGAGWKAFRLKLGEQAKIASRPAAMIEAQQRRTIDPGCSTQEPLLRVHYRDYFVDVRNLRAP